MSRVTIVLGESDIKPEGCVIGVDYGAFVCARDGVEMILACGDFDSVSQEEFKRIQECAETMIQLKCRKDESDTKEAIDFIKKQDYNEIVVLGGLFGRFDHTWANLQLLQCNPDLIWMDEKNRLRIFQPGRHVIFKEDYHYISFFSLKKGKITLESMEYPLKDYELQPLDSLGLSNEIIGESGILECDVPVLCIQCHD